MGALAGLHHATLGKMGGLDCFPPEDLQSPNQIAKGVRVPQGFGFGELSGEGDRGWGAAQHLVMPADHGEVL